MQPSSSVERPAAVNLPVPGGPSLRYAPRSMKVPYGTPKVLPVDDQYRIRSPARAAVRRRMRLHGFHLVAPWPDRAVDGRFDLVSSKRGLSEYRIRLRRPIHLVPGEVAALPDLPPLSGGAVAGQIDADERVRLIVEGEPLPTTSRRQAWRWRIPLQGSAALVAGPRGCRLRAVTVWTYRPSRLEITDRYPLHVPLRVGRQLLVPLVSWRMGLPIDQISIHWGSVEYRLPDRTRPLVAWGYPFYLDGVLGDVDAINGGRVESLARGKFLEFDEVENIRCKAPVFGDTIRITLRPRAPEVPVPVCRIASLEVRYRIPAAVEPKSIEVGRWVRRGRSLRLGPGRVSIGRVDLLWSDRGPAMGALSLGSATSRFVNVCSGEQRMFAYLHGARPAELRLHAKEADIMLERATIYPAK